MISASPRPCGFLPCATYFIFVPRFADAEETGVDHVTNVHVGVVSNEIVETHPVLTK